MREAEFWEQLNPDRDREGASEPSKRLPFQNNYPDVHEGCRLLWDLRETIPRSLVHRQNITET